tara:strand:+ start:210 stop:338 length:129 start_codon:yes stop_codon:yes gene_type:complete
VSVINKDTGAKVIGNPDPIELMKQLKQAYIEDVLPAYLKLIE